MPIELAVEELKALKPDFNPVALVGHIDNYTTYPSKGLTPKKLTTVLEEADLGDITRQAELFEDMLEKDSFLFGLFHSRKMAVLRENYEIMIDSEENEDLEVKEFVKQVFEQAKNWRQNVEDLLDAVPKGFSANWIGWRLIPDARGTVVFDRLNNVHQKNFRWGKASDMQNADLNQLRRLTEGDLLDGVEMEPFKWVVPIIKARAGHSTRTSLMRSVTWPYLFKNFGVKAFMIYAEKFGMPLLVGKYEDAATKEAKEALEKAVQGLSTDSRAILSKTTEIELIKDEGKQSTSDLHLKLLEFMKSEMSVTVLGHTGSSQSTPGKLGNEDMAKDVREDIVQSDAISAVDYPVSDQLIKPLVIFRFGQRRVYPYYKTSIPKTEDLLREVQIDQKLVEMGVPLSVEYAYDKYKRPKPDKDQTLITPPVRQTPFDSAVAKGLLGRKSDLLR